MQNPTRETLHKVFICLDANPDEKTKVSGACSILPKMMMLHISEEASHLVYVNLKPTDTEVQQIFCGSTATDCQPVYCKNRTLYFDEEDENVKDNERPCRFKDNLPKGFRLLNLIKVQSKDKIKMLKSQESFDPLVNKEASRTVSDTQKFTLKLKSNLVDTEWNHFRDGQVNSAHISRQSILNTAWPRSPMNCNNTRKNDDKLYGIAHVVTEHTENENIRFNCDFVTLLPQGQVWLTYALLCILPEEAIKRLGLGLKAKKVISVSFF